MLDEGQLAATRDAAIRRASIERRRWTLPWEEVAQLIEVELGQSDDEWFLMVRWACPSEGISGAFDVENGPQLRSAIEFGLTERIGDLAAELWRADL